MTDSQTFLAGLEPLAHHDRIRRAIELGRAARAGGEPAAILAALEQGPAFARWLSLYACAGSRDGARAVRALGDPSRRVRQLALDLVAVLASDDQIAAVEGTLIGAQREQLVRHLRRRRRFAAVDALLGRLAAAEDPALGALLPYGSAACAERLLAAAEPRGGALLWSRLASFHPALAARALADRAAALVPGDAPDERLILHANFALPRLAQLAPDAALSVVRALAPAVPLARLMLVPVALRRPQEVVSLVTASGDEVLLHVGPVAHLLSDSELRARVAAGVHQLGAAERWLKRLPPARRGALFADLPAAFGETVDPEILALLPRAQREAEARRHFALPALQAQTQERLRYAALLPWDEAREALAPYLGHPEGEIRGAAGYALGWATAFARARLSELLAAIRRRRNEQDPVRGRLLAGLLRVSATAFGAEHLEALSGVFADTLKAADLSGATAVLAEALIVKLLPRHPQAAAGWLQELVEKRGNFGLGDLESRLSPADVRALAPALLPVLEAWQQRERWWPLLSFAASLGHRLADLDGLPALLEKFLQAHIPGQVLARALTTLTRYRRRELDRLVPPILAQDPSAFVLDLVHGHLHRRRQDLLGPYLGLQPYRGRWGTGKTAFLAHWENGHHRWTPAQQETYAASVEALLGQSRRSNPEAWWAIGTLAQLCWTGPERLVAVARVKDEALRDSALRALGRLDGGEGVPELLAALGDDRGRIAIYALRPSVLALPPARAVEVLRGVPLAKVTVAKEVLRLLGDLPTPAAFALLREKASEDLHRDARIALLRALWGHLDRREAWELLERAAAGGDPAQATALVGVPADRLDAEGRRRLVGILAALLSGESAAVRLEVLQRCERMPIAEPERVLAGALVRLCFEGTPGEREPAARALVAGAGVTDAQSIAAALSSRRASRRGLVAAISALAEQAKRDRRRLAPIVRAVLTALADDAPALGLRLDLAAAALPPAELVATLEELSARGVLHAEALGGAGSALASYAGPDGDALDAIAGRLAAAAEPLLRRFAIYALWGAANGGRGWNSARLGVLATLRADPSPLVAGSAQLTFPPEEEAPPAA